VSISEIYSAVLYAVKNRKFIKILHGELECKMLHDDI
jgi:hypothetical protein